MDGPAHQRTHEPAGEAARGEAELRLDLRGLHCPMPVLRARKALRGLAVGQAVTLECTDPLSAIDIPHFVAEAGHELAAAERRDGLLLFRIVKRR